MSRIALIAALTVGLMLFVGATMTQIGPWYRALHKPDWNPPDWVFGPAWTIILSLAAWAGVLGWSNTSDPQIHLRIAALFAANILLHMMWSPLFFNLRRPDWALIEVPFLWISVLVLMVYLKPFSALASWLLTPYLLWVTFAAYLNLVIVRMNPPFGSPST